MFSPSHSAQTYNRHFHEERPPFFASTPCLCGTREKLIRIRLIASERLTVPGAAPFIDERAGEKTEQKKWGGAPCDVSILRSVRLRGC